MSASRPRGLCVYEPTGNGTETRLLGSGETRHRDARSAYGLGLFIVSTEQGKSALMELARQIIDGFRAADYPILYPSADRHFRHLKSWIEFFLGTLRNHPPDVYLTSIPGEAMTVRWDWRKAESTLEDFKPFDAGRLELNAMIMAGMAGAPPRRHSAYMFQMAIAVAHEIGHFLTSFITGKERARTPPQASIPGARAEAGFFWERNALQGIVEFYADPEEPDNVNQPGIAYLFADARGSAAGSMVSPEYIQDVVSGAFGFKVPIETVRDQPTVTRAQLRRTHWKMSDLRDRAAQAQSRLVISGTSGAGRDTTRDRYVQRQHNPSQMQQYPGYPSQQYPSYPSQQYPSYPSQQHPSYPSQQYPSYPSQQYSGGSRQQYSDQTQQHYYPRQDYYGGPNY